MDLGLQFQNCATTSSIGCDMHASGSHWELCSNIYTLILRKKKEKPKKQNYSNMCFFDLSNPKKATKPLQYVCFCCLYTKNKYILTSFFWFNKPNSHIFFVLGRGRVLWRRGGRGVWGGGGRVIFWVVFGVWRF